MNKPIRAVVGEDSRHPIGSAVLTVEGYGRELIADATRVYLDTGSDDGKVLGPSGFQKSEVWLTPAMVEPLSDGGRIILSGELVSPLRSGMSMRIRVTDDNGTTLGETAVAWPAITPLGGGRSARKFGFVAGVEPGAPKTERPIFDETATVEPANPVAQENPVVDTFPDPIVAAPQGDGTRTRQLSIIAGIAVLLFLAAAGGYVLWGLGDGAQHASGQDLSKWNRKEVAAYLSSNSGAGETHATGEKLINLHKIDLAFLIFRENARRGHSASSLAIGKMYDPKFHSPQTSPMPQADGHIAAENYRVAAQGGLAEAQRLLGEMLSIGKDVPKNIEEAVHWLRKAAEQGDRDAQTLLSKLTTS